MSYLSTAQVLKSITPAAVDERRVRTFTRTTQHTALGFALLREVAIWATYLSHVAPAKRKTWTRNQAILGGHLVRLAKLLRALLQDVRDRRAETAWVLSRLVAECTINLRYMIECYTPGLLDSYVYQSLQHEVQLERRIRTNIEARSGRALNIEKRMLRSIAKTFRNSQVKPSEVPTARIQNWGNKSIYERAKAVGLESAYASVIGAPSRNVHGNWQDLLQHHLLVRRPGQYLPNAETQAVRPQLLNVLGVLAVEAMQAFLVQLKAPDGQLLLDRLADLDARIMRADRLHEAFVSAGRRATGEEPGRA